MIFLPTPEAAFQKQNETSDFCVSRLKVSKLLLFIQFIPSCPRFNLVKQQDRSDSGKVNKIFPIRPANINFLFFLIACHQLFFVGKISLERQQEEANPSSCSDNKERKQEDQEEVEATTNCDRD